MALTERSIYNDGEYLKDVPRNERKNHMLVRHAIGKVLSTPHTIHVVSRSLGKGH